jgi:hypothetical protein
MFDRNVLKAAILGAALALSATPSFAGASQAGLILFQQSGASPNDLAGGQMTSNATWLKVLASADHRVRDVQLISGDNPKLTAASLKAVRRWRSVPSQAVGAGEWVVVQMVYNAPHMTAPARFASR